MASAFEVLAMAKTSFYDNSPTAYLTQATVQGVPTGSAFSTAVAFDSETEDNWNGHSNATNNSRYTSQVAGVYLCNGQITYTNSSGLEVRALAWAKNGTLLTGTETYNQSYSNNFLTVASTLIVRLAVGDYVQMFTWQNTGATLNTVTPGTSMAISYLHA